jgi:Ran GTPase-activating protein (RanGAP) involved in mRNA processing and transport
MAQADKLRTDKHIALIDAGIVTKSQIQRELQVTDEYQFDDDAIDALEELEAGGNMFDEPVDFADRYVELTDSGLTHDGAMVELS